MLTPCVNNTPVSNGSVSVSRIRVFIYSMIIPSIQREKYIRDLIITRFRKDQEPYYLQWGDYENILFCKIHYWQIKDVRILVLNRTWYTKKEFAFFFRPAVFQNYTFLVSHWIRNNVHLEKASFIKKKVFLRAVPGDRKGGIRRQQTVSTVHMPSDMYATLNEGSRTRG